MLSKMCKRISRTEHKLSAGVASLPMKKDEAKICKGSKNEMQNFSPHPLAPKFLVSSKAETAACGSIFPGRGGPWRDCTCTDIEEFMLLMYTN